MRELIVELCRNFYDLDGTGTEAALVSATATRYLCLSGVQKERIQPDDIFTVSRTGEVLSSPIRRG